VGITLCDIRTDAQDEERYAGLALGGGLGGRFPYGDADGDSYSEYGFGAISYSAISSNTATLARRSKCSPTRRQLCDQFACFFSGTGWDKLWFSEA